MLSFKKYLITNFFNKYAWKKLDALPSNLDDITHVFDLVNLVFWSKPTLPFQVRAVFRSHTSDADADAEVEAWFQKQTIYDSKYFFIVPYPNEFSFPTNILLVINKQSYDALDELTREYYITINCYVNLVLQKFVHRTWDEINARMPLNEYALNWVWFRKVGSRMTRLMWERARTWVHLNPDLKIVLWTDISDAQELGDFLEDLPKEEQDPFWNGRIKVMYLQDTLTFVQNYAVKHELPQEFNMDTYLRLIEMRENGYVLIAKTDYLRGMILHDHGGFYADFNDCACMIPMRYWFHEIYNRQSYILPCDTFNPNQKSNYFAFVPPGSDAFATLYTKTLKNFGCILKFVRDCSRVKHVIANMYLPLAQEFWKKMKTTRIPTAELVELMTSFYKNNFVFRDIEQSLTFNVSKAIRMSDPRAIMFFPVYIFKYISEKQDIPQLKFIYDYMVNQFLKISRFESNHTIYFDKLYQESFKESNSVNEVHDLVTELLNTCLEDEDFLTYLHYQFVRNFTFIAMDMTNFTMHVGSSIMKDLIPSCYVRTNMTLLTLIGHFGDGGSMQRES